MIYVKFHSNIQDNHSQEPGSGVKEMDNKMAYLLIVCNYKLNHLSLDCDLDSAEMW